MPEPKATADETALWIEQIKTTHAAAAAAAAAAEQAIRDALDAGVTVAAISRDGLGTKNRQRVYAVMGRGSDGAPATAPQPRPTVYLQGKDGNDEAWARVREAMWARGWDTVSDHETAFHRARGGVPVVSCNFSSYLDESGGAWFGYHLYVLVGMVRARYSTTTYHSPILDILTTEERDRARQDAEAGDDWASRIIERYDREHELVPVSEIKRTRPLRDLPEGSTYERGLDEQALARMVAEVLAVNGITTPDPEDDATGPTAEAAR